MISNGLRALRQLGRECQLVWVPYNFLIDQSSAEEGGIVDCFRGVYGGHRNID
jgi:hypothetical protein